MMTMPVDAPGRHEVRPHDESAALALRAANGDRAAFATLIERHYDAIHGIAWRWCGDADEAEDIAQDVAVKLARSIRSWRGEAAFTTWLYRIVLNAVRDRKRSAAAERRRADAYAVHSLVEAQGQGVQGDDPLVRLWNAVGRLPERQRDAVLLVHGEGMTHSDAAAVLGVSEGTVSFHIHEAKKKLRAMMDRPEDET